MDIDLVHLNLNTQSINILKFIIGLIIFGIALELKINDFKNIIKNPKGLLAGLISQIVTFPLLTILLIYFWSIKPSIALGLIMIAACPGGNIGNLVSSLVRGNVALSIGLTSIATIISLFITPLILLLLGEHFSETKNLLSTIQLDHREIMMGVLIILGLPLFLGMSTTKLYPKLSLQLQKIMKKISLVFLLVFIIGALVSNFQNFLNYLTVIIGITLAHNLLALLAGYLTAKIFHLPINDCRSLVVFNGFKNTSLGLALVFQFFQGLGGMAMIVAWWGISQIIVNFCLMKFYKYIDKKRS